jgi:hypothetical protein
MLQSIPAPNYDNANHIRKSNELLIISLETSKEVLNISESVL